MFCDGGVEHGRAEVAIVGPSAFELPFHEFNFDAYDLIVAGVFDRPRSFNTFVVGDAWICIVG